MNKNAKIYVAGHMGMVGSAIVRELKQQGYCNLLFRTHQELDLSCRESVFSFFNVERPEYVFLAAALVGGIRANSQYPADFLIQNLCIQNNVLEASRIYEVQKLLFLGSACVYPKDCPQPIKEEYLMSGFLEPTNEPYSIAKIAGIRACEYYNKQYGTNFICAMPANSYGIGDCFDIEKSHVIPAMIHRFQEAKETAIPQIIFWGSGNPLREFIYVDDLANACVFLMNVYDHTELINIGGLEEISIRSLAEKIKALVHYHGRIEFDTLKPDGMMRRLVDRQKIANLGWSPQTDIDTGLSMVYRHYLQLTGRWENYNEF